ncbi:transposable element Tcb2 transposase [Trichonephila clavipes]|uniref:Transposable element Tcb2 transposase n=1 Tax=Trichonephila clavipes TaxID=2585209 RepID=A0A8X6RYI4_TRICX|nr:transposable element Tcb2 transposase [Trichonephila clavipes]
MAVTNRSVTSRTIAPHNESVTHHSASARTIRCRLQQRGFFARCALLGLPLTQNHRLTHLSATPRWSESSRETPWREDAEQQRYAPPHLVWGGIGCHSRTTLVRIASTLNSQRYISEVLEPIVLPYLQGLATAIFQQDNARPPVARIVQRFFVNHQIELLPCPARSPDLSPIESMWSMVVQRLTQIIPSAATPY